MFRTLLISSMLLLCTGCCQTVRVGTKDAYYYHRNDCARVHQSWAEGGTPVRYYSWNGIRAVNRSGRIPDNKVCFAGREFDESVNSGKLQYPKVDSNKCKCTECPKNK